MGVESGWLDRRQMGAATFRFYAELNDFLPVGDRQRDLVRSFLGRPSVKDQIEACGVPHTEVDLILVNGRSVGFDHGLGDGDRVSVYPVFEALDVTPVVHLRPRPLREKRILRTRDRGLLKRRELTHAAAVHGTDPREQLPEVVRRFDLARSAAPFTRCLTCNGRLAAVPKEEVLDRLPPETRLHYDAFLPCLSCRRVFWWGPHSRRLREIVEEALRFGRSGG